MRNFSVPLNLMFCILLGSAASAEELYSIASGSPVGNLEAFQECDVCPEMVVLPMGVFQMGSSLSEANAARMRAFLNTNSDPTRHLEKPRSAFLHLGLHPDQPELGLLKYYESGNIVRTEDPQYSGNPFLHELPQHPVSIDMPIAMGRNEVTREEWAACVQDGVCEQGQHDVPRYAYVACDEDANCIPTPDARVRFRLPNGPHATHPRSPMTGLTYREMETYTNWLNEKVGAKVYRLPTEAEWEYAARAGTSTRFAQGDTLTLEQANFLVYRIDIVDGSPVWNYELGSARELLPVDALDAANDWGLRHMSGNAAERTSTCGEGPHRNLASSSEYLDADEDQVECARAIKGGFYAGNVELARPARRTSRAGDSWSPWIGFRVVRDLAPMR